MYYVCDFIVLSFLLLSFSTYLYISLGFAEATKPVIGQSL